MHPCYPDKDYTLQISYNFPLELKSFRPTCIEHVHSQARSKLSHVWRNIVESGTKSCYLYRAEKGFSVFWSHRQELNCSFSLHPFNLHICQDNLSLSFVQRRKKDPYVSHHSPNPQRRHRIELNWIVPWLYAEKKSGIYGDEKKTSYLHLISFFIRKRRIKSKRPIPFWIRHLES